jgi:glycosyltransferase involved in cell wall biosynthesis
MRVLHVGWGFRPWRDGGLIAYVEDVMAGQAARGHDVAYFFAGRYLPGDRPPHLRRWERDGVTMLELFNGRVIPGVDAGTLDPDLELDEPAAEAAFRRALDLFRPDVVHVQELMGLPSSLLTIPREQGIPVVLSLQDYHLLCPTLKLFDAEGRNCTRLRPGEMCALCCANAPGDAAIRVRKTLKHAVLRTNASSMAAHNAVERTRHHPAVAAVMDREPVQAVLRRFRPAPPPADAEELPRARTAPPAAYDRRREVNAARMGQVDAVLAMSRRVQELCVTLGVPPEHLRVLHFTLSHLAVLQPSDRIEPQDPMVFAILNGCSSAPKGVDVVLDALRGLAARGLRGRFRFEVWGFVAHWRRAHLDADPDVALMGNYTSDDLERALHRADVGIIPSVWEEAYAYTGPEMLACGVPVIGNARGGITDYVVPGQTGWLNATATGAELVEIVAGLVAAPEAVARLREGLRRERPPAVKPMGRHLDELEAVYGELVS